MQLHACLLLFIITTDKGLALQQHCGGNVSLDNEPTGHFNLTLPGLFTDDNNTDTLDSMNQHSDKTLSVCTWTIGVPQGLTVLLKLDTGLRVSVRCVLNEEDEVLESGGTTLLSRCHGNEATFTWTGSGRSPDHIQLSYSVQEDERNSSADHTSPRSGPDLLDSTQTGTSSASDSPEGRDFVRGTEGVRGHLYEGLEWRSEARSTSGPSSQDQDRLHPTSPLQGASAAGRADRETLPLPEEGPNNGADTSGAARRADATERTRPSFQPSLGTDAPFHTSSHAAKTSSDPRTRMTRAAASSSDAYTHRYTATRGSELSASTPAPPGSSVPPLTSSPTPWESGTALIPPSGGVSGASGEKGPGSWRTQRSTDRLYSDPVSAVTSDPLKPPTEAQQEDSTDTGPTASSSSSSSSSSQGPTLHITGLNTAAGSDPNPGRTDSSVPTVSDVTSHAAAFESSDGLSLASSTAPSQTNPPENTESLGGSMPPHLSSPSTRTSKAETQTSTQGLTKEDHRILSSSPTAAVTLGDVVQTSAPPGTTTDSESYTPGPVYTTLKDDSSTNTPTPVPPLSSPPSNTHQTHTALPASPTSNPLPSPSAATEQHTAPPNHETPTVPSQTIASTFTHTPHTQNPPPSPSSTEEPRSYITTTPLLSHTTAGDGHGGGGVEDVEKRFPSSTMRQTPTAGAPSWTTSSPPGQENHMTLTPSASASSWSSETSQTPKFYIVPDRPVGVTVESIELLLQIVVEESRSAFTPGLEEDTTAWVEPYLRKAPGFSKLLGVWSSGHAVQSLVQFKTSGALQWLGRTGSTSLLERTGLAQAVCDGRSFRSSKITNITLGGLQADVCDWLLQCPAGYECVFQPGTSNYSCSSVCHFDYCHHHGICTHHPGGQLPVCRCLVGEDFWYMGRRCDVRMTRARLVGACLAVLLVIVTVIGILALVAVRRYRAILIQAKVDQTRSSYRRFNHFDELSGRFWLRSWAGSADSLDNPAFTRSDELLHLRALDRPCCYHDDTLSLASTCPSHGTRINTIYPHSSQYGWRGSEMSMGEGVLDSGKASDLSVCSWPVEPIQWTPFPLLQQLASHRTPTQVRVSRPRSYCEGMELVDLGKSWTA